MIIFEHYRDVYYTGFIAVNSMVRTLAKLDTGASKTIIGLGEFTKVLRTQQFSNYISEYVGQNGIAKHTFVVVDDRELQTYPCFFESVYIDGAEVERFAFELINNVESRKMLVGDDFICCCKFSHEVSGNIIFTEFDNVKYDTSIRQSRINMNKLIGEYRKAYLNNSEPSQSNVTVDELNRLQADLHKSLK